MNAVLALFLIFLPAAPPDDIVSVGEENARRAWVPDLKRADARIEIPSEKRIDVLILGDGYLADERKDFEKDVHAWHDGFVRLTPWNRLRGAFRVRGLWTPSEGRATPDRKSHYKIPATLAEVGKVDDAATRAAVFAALDKTGANKAQRKNPLTHAVVVMLLRNDRGRNPSGMTTRVVSPDEKRSVSVAFAAYTHHEFAHAYGGLQDEYIRGENGRSNRKPPERLSIHSLSNLAYTKDPKRLPWAHLLPGSAANPDAKSLIGLLWLGGIDEEGAWHSEAMCLMNGTHENWDLRKERRGATLRDPGRFCFWCEEILVARTFEKTGQLGDSTDGEALWKKWAEEVRPLYYKSFDVPGRIKVRNEENARAKLAEAKIYERPAANSSAGND